MKNLLRVIVVLIIFILGIVLIDKVFVEDKKIDEEPKKELEIEQIDFEVSFLIDTFVRDYETIEFTEEEQKEISLLISKLNYKEETVDLAILGDYKILFDDCEVYFDDNSDPYGYLIKGDEHKIINIENLKETILEYVHKKNILKVFLYYRDDISTTNFTRVNISDEDKTKLLNVADSIKVLQPHEYVNLMIAGRFYLIVDDTVLYFDNFPGYIMKDNEMGYMSDEFTNILSKYINDDGPLVDDCCSCCPDAGPNDTCISLCCPCN